ncbi:DUF1120 domain-containing protein [Pseudomonas sp. ICMP 460]|uniref:DUF1120 domain-containing protein n=1 Tax=Pseudomonas sp. ICMP 460 TaxID=1718917 RepID=UPI000C08A3DB|nr:DUF1120 domain-containing protein [Pseudomonas sp. ICMP 460]
MMNFSKKALFGAMLIASSASAFALDNAPLTVSGVVVPAACTPAFTGGGDVDYGTIPSASLNAGAVTALADMPVPYTIHCDAPIAIGTSWTDSRTGTAPGTSYNFGLGKQGANNIGWYIITHDTTASTGDGARVDVIYSPNGVTGWAVPTAATENAAHDGSVLAFAPPGTLVPGAYTDVAGVLTVSAAINPTNGLDLTTAITLDGLSTMTVRYL